MIISLFGILTETIAIVTSVPIVNNMKKKDSYLYVIITLHLLFRFSQRRRCARFSDFQLITGGGRPHTYDIGIFASIGKTTDAPQTFPHESFRHDQDSNPCGKAGLQATD